ncbi:DUF6428 family protein [Flavobacterium sp. SUN046]|uniref:DUF6428 family protein n=1 Tax=Flavobacterium sp. SUN046 TaxID=3002440 RepID=UPI002DB86B17|nr:DUF6428 family protein [Flavobacterium sp. SUN046]MEC4048513.1 DUF6428 family protein [Flavobacterium sp. SUN046]
MKLSEFKNHLSSITHFNIALTDGQLVPSHFHITEMGLLTKNYIDCGNTIRQEHYLSFQVWFAGDLEHRLLPSKVFKIMDASQALIGDNDLDIEVEYQMESTIGKFGIEFENGIFILTPKETTCLAQDHCGIPQDKMKVPLGAWKAKTSCCAPDSNCC